MAILMTSEVDSFLCLPVSIKTLGFWFAASAVGIGVIVVVVVAVFVVVFVLHQRSTGCSSVGGEQLSVGADQLFFL